ncbi:hypothetical protein CBS115989_8251 [Aspergillus niger]|nr:uncharacterized protein BO96DRAFT_411337 [Aspergillus niger CBS 101883]KAI2814809.1 hypothetical protein CBS115989_8251 [Aspergillus niger]KAI2845810.1 hypothetical protein CBS11232_7592 [Aspergillus niger]KAI2850398.1 hypothetical protein CBS11350_1700 [Aspergillus niger]KAI2872424.1 hypothetical protein CBS11852_10855 [Aspergillus niger]KAI2874250.1 hypothetical protein CBS115988_6360 [Aspergillus niger]
MMDSSPLPYHGSCHCGLVKFIAIISMPPVGVRDSAAPPPPSPSQPRFYKCNCSTCHKSGVFHMRLPDAPNEFFLFSPLNLEELSNYQCFKRLVNWYFCPTCGVRCFGVAARWKKDSIEPERFNLAISSEEGKQITPIKDNDEQQRISVLRLDPEGYKENQTGYFSLNALTIDQDQPHGKRLDLRRIVDNKWLEYLDRKEGVADMRYDYPQEGGTW